MYKKTILLMFVLILLSSFVSAYNSSDIISLYRFEYNTNDYVDNNNGTIYGLTSYNISKGNNNTGNYSIDLRATANDFINISDSDNLDFDKYLSISLWVYQNRTGVSSKWLAKYVTTANQRSFSLGITSFKNIIFIVSNDGATLHQLQSSTLMNEKEWTFIVATADTNNNILKIYINGIQDNNYTNVGLTSIYQSSSDLFIGQNNAGSQNFNGFLDEIAFYNKTLNQTEIIDIYNNGIDYMAMNETIPINETINESIDLINFAITDINLYNVSFFYLFNDTCNISGSVDGYLFSGTDNSYYEFDILNLDSNTIYNITSICGDVEHSSLFKTKSIEEMQLELSERQFALIWCIAVLIILLILYVLAEVFRLEILGILAGLGLIVASFGCWISEIWFFLIVLTSGLFIIIRFFWGFFRGN